MDAAERPQFPFRVVWRETGMAEAYEDELDLLQNLEDFDSNDAADKDEAAVTDALGRPMNLVVRIYDNLCEYSLDHR